MTESQEATYREIVSRLREAAKPRTRRTLSAKQSERLAKYEAADKKGKARFKKVPTNPAAGNSARDKFLDSLADQGDTYLSSAIHRSMGPTAYSDKQWPYVLKATSGYGMQLWMESWVGRVCQECGNHVLAPRTPIDPLIVCGCGGHFFKPDELPYQPISTELGQDLILEDLEATI